MNEFMISLSSITNLLNPVMTFAMLLAATFFIFFLKEKVQNMEDYFKSIAISLQQIANHMSKHK